MKKLIVLVLVLAAIAALLGISLGVRSAKADCVARYGWTAPSMGDTSKYCGLSPLVPLPTDTIYAHRTVFRFTNPVTIDSSTFVVLKGQVIRDSVVTPGPTRRYAVVKIYTTRYSNTNGKRILRRSNCATSVLLVTK